MQLVWFRCDLRLADHLALTAASAAGPVLPIYILEPQQAVTPPLGSASRVWLHYGLQALQQDVNGQLNLFAGDAQTIILALCRRYAVTAVHWQRGYEPWRIAYDTQLKQALTQAGIAAHSYNGSLLWEPWQVLKADQTPYQVFTPYYRNGCLNAPPPRLPLPVPCRLTWAPRCDESLPLDALQLLPALDWPGTMMQHWPVGEAGAQQRWQHFLAQGLEQYTNGRDCPASAAVSTLSPYLHFGHLSVHQLWHDLQHCDQPVQRDAFCRQLAWREFAYYQLYHCPQLPYTPLRAKFARFAWQPDATVLRAWKTGQTGYPLVDAGMRQLWQTGYMHNRVRMIVASFLVKNLLQPWQQGAAWFWDCLVDADLANNSASWQWVAGCGVDAAPYFRLFNPITQGEKFDPKGEYTRHYLPQLRALPDRYLFKPWCAPQSVLTCAGIILGQHYPEPIIDLQASRQRALAVFKSC